jgi:hypothetical protein
VVVAVAVAGVIQRARAAQVALAVALMVGLAHLLEIMELTI